MPDDAICSFRSIIPAAFLPAFVASEEIRIVRGAETLAQDRGRARRCMRCRGWPMRGLNWWVP
jgi:hypothetical protein